MKRIFTFVAALLTTTVMMAQGWPNDYTGVMLQGFSWDSYSESNWVRMEQNADELSQYFNVIWVPNSAYAGSTSMNMGYHPVYWFDHRSAFGTEAELRSMINTFKGKNVGIIEDVVVNHRNGKSGWVDFPAETDKGVTYQITLADICNDDECATNGYKPTGAADTGVKWDGARDLDHTSANVQANVKAYLDFLKNDLGYAGFRYDLVKGYSANYVGQYNAAAQPVFSVGECWDGYAVITNWINGTKVGGVIQSAAFDFPMKYNMNSAFDSGTWSSLNNSSLAQNRDYCRYAVTFVDNHDTYKDGGAVKSRVEAANAYMLTMPGTPCVFLRHWVQMKTAIKRMIFVRKAAGISNVSTITEQSAQTNGYVLKVKGHNSSVLLLLGATEGVSTNGYKLAVEGDGYSIYVEQGLDITGLDNIKEEGGSFVPPAFCTPEEGKLYVFFEAPVNWSSTNIRCWCWNGSTNFTGGTWPGTSCTLVGTATNGNKVWKWTGSAVPDVMPTGIIFSSGGSPQTTDMSFINGGYYDIDGLKGDVITDVDGVTASDAEATRPVTVYTVDGRVIRKAPADEALKGLRPGLYVAGKKKVAVYE